MATESAYASRASGHQCPRPIIFIGHPTHRHRSSLLSFVGRDLNLSYVCTHPYRLRQKICPHGSHPHLTTWYICNDPLNAKKRFLRVFPFCDHARVYSRWPLPPSPPRVQTHDDCGRKPKRKSPQHFIYLTRRQRVL